MAEFPPPTFSAFARRPSNLLSVFSIAVWVYVVAHAIATGLMFTAVDSARDFANDSSLKQAFDDAIRPVNVVSYFAWAAWLTIAVTTFIWTYRVTREVTNRGVLLKFSPALCMFSWLLPPALFIFPLIVLRDLVSKTKTMRGDQQEAIRPVITQWWFFFGFVPFVMWLLGTAQSSTSFSNTVLELDQDQAQTMSDQIIPSTIAGLSLIAAAIMWRRIVNTLSAQLEI